MAISQTDLEEVRKKGFRPEVVGCFVYECKLLLLYGRKHDLWQLPQGGIEKNETVEQALMREMGEELGKDFVSGIKKITFLESDEIIFPKGKLSGLSKKSGIQKSRMKGKKYFFFAIQVSGGDIDIRRSEFDNYLWVSYETAKKLIGTVSQKGKQRVMTKILQSLHALGFIH